MVPTSPSHPISQEGANRVPVNTRQHLHLREEEGTVCVSVCVCVYVCVCVCMHACVHACVCTSLPILSAASFSVARDTFPSLWKSNTKTVAREPCSAGGAGEGLAG